MSELITKSLDKILILSDLDRRLHRWLSRYSCSHLRTLLQFVAQILNLSPLVNNCELELGALSLQFVDQTIAFGDFLLL